MYSPEAVAHRLCEQMDWSISQLSVQKAVYMSHMVHMGANNGEALILEPFEAWDYGPVLPSLYHRLKMFGRKPIKNVFWGNPVPDGTSQADVIDSIASQIKGFSPAQLVAITHDPKGAWAKNYRPGAKNILIPNKDIVEEYEWRSKQAA